MQFPQFGKEFQMDSQDPITYKCPICKGESILEAKPVGKHFHFNKKTCDFCKGKKN